ncbi:HAD-IA family hydrolase [Paraliomyxa miuraensis]|uniref:HAD-IA family hydrolase n=1 Tax=Paraliomyxa miuraensis TaxID=376150 RepID=UPI00224F9B6F|nr:HAD-IA family hydrolase [Paraliomyxa miuraensis]MCX4242108.1 HAD-IA family hydrolase [Paraliomyxa miuraensis]
MPKSSPRVLLLDVMDTLVHDPFFAEIPRFFGTSLRQLLPQLRAGAWVEFELDALDEATFLSRFFADGRAFDGPGLLATVRAGYRLLPGIEPLLAELRGRGVPMHALSNYPRWYRYIEEELRLSRYLQWSFVSCNTGVRKPDPQAYLGAAAALGVEPSACTFVDDRQSNCAAACSVGMDAVCFSDAASLRSALVERGVLAEAHAVLPDEG